MHLVSCSLSRIGMVKKWVVCVAYWSSLYQRSSFLCLLLVGEQLSFLQPYRNAVFSLAFFKSNGQIVPTFFWPAEKGTVQQIRDSLDWWKTPRQLKSRRTWTCSTGRARGTTIWCEGQCLHISPLNCTSQQLKNKDDLFTESSITSHVCVSAIREQQVSQLCHVFG